MSNLRRRAHRSRDRFVAVLALLAACCTPAATCQLSGESWPGGIGAILGHSADEHRLMIRDVPPGTPAAEAGLRVGDEILQIEGREVAEMELREVVAALRGEVGTKVKLQVKRGAETLEVRVIRAPYRD